jgi:hypothetical protein
VLDSHVDRRSPLRAIMASLLAAAGLVVCTLVPRPALAAATPDLRTAGNFAILAGSTITNTGATVIAGDLGLSPGTSVTGFPPGTVVGATHIADAAASQAKTDLTEAYIAAAAEPVTTDLTGQDLGGKTLTPGVYHFASSAQLTGTLTLDGQNNPHAVFIFQMGSTLTTATNSQVLLTNGALASGVFWQVGSSATLGTGTSLQGNLIALASITMVTGSSIVTGRALALNGAVTLDTNRITVPAAPPIGGDPGPGGKTGTVTAITASSADPSVVGQAVTFTATVATSPASIGITGTVMFRDETANLGTVPLSAGQARLITSALTVGDHFLIATYSGNDIFGSSKSYPFFQTVFAA